MSALCLQLSCYTQLRRAENRGLKIHAATFFQGTPSASDDLYACEVNSGRASPCPSRRERHRGPQTGGYLATPTPGKGAVGSSEEPLPPIFLAHALSISLIRTIDLFILSGGEGEKNPTCHLCDINISGNS